MVDIRISSNRTQNTTSVKTPPSGRKILVIDDEPDVTELIEYKLKNEGFEVRISNNPLQILGAIKEFLPDLIILDIMMPELSGIQLCKMIRSNSDFESIPIIFLTAKGDSPDRVKGLEAGADDYITKPFNTIELILRIRSIFKRVAGRSEKAPAEISIRGVCINPDSHTVKVDGREVILTATEFRLINILMSRCGKVHTRESLLTHVWNYNADVETRTVDTHVRRLREKLEPKGDIIKTVRGVGYTIPSES
jgi:two-component system phosphate regulon response regulator PhoB